jgi:hypothetical protein
MNSTQNVLKHTYEHLLIQTYFRGLYPAERGRGEGKGGKGGRKFAAPTMPVCLCHCLVTGSGFFRYFACSGNKMSHARMVLTSCASVVAADAKRGLTVMYQP